MNTTANCTTQDIQAGDFVQYRYMGAYWLLCVDRVHDGIVYGTNEDENETAIFLSEVVENLGQ